MRMKIHKFPKLHKRMHLLRGSKREEDSRENTLNSSRSNSSGTSQLESNSSGTSQLESNLSGTRLTGSNLSESHSSQMKLKTLVKHLVMSEALPQGTSQP